MASNYYVAGLGYVPTPKMTSLLCELVAPKRILLERRLIPKGFEVVDLSDNNPTRWFSTSTVRGLQARGLIDGTGSVTPFGVKTLNTLKELYPKFLDVPQTPTTPKTPLQRAAKSRRDMAA